MERLRVLHFINVFEHGGAETMIRDLIAASDPERFEHQVALLYFRDKAAGALEESSVRVRRVRLRSWMDPRAPLAVSRAVREGSPDVLHTHLPTSDLYGRLMRWPSVRPALVSTLHNVAERYFKPDALHRVQMGLWRWAMRRWPAEIVGCAQFVSDSFGPALAPQKITTVLNGRNEEALDAARWPSRVETRASLHIPAEAPVAINVARLRRVKGHNELIEAFKEVLRAVPEARLLIVGEGPRQGLIEEKIRSEGLTESVRCLGLRRDVPALLHASDVFVLASRWEGLPISLVEAMLCGLAVVSTDVGGVPEVVENEATGLLVPHDDVAGLAAALTRFLSDMQAARETGKRAREYAREHLSARAMAKAYEAVYLRAVESRGR